MISKKRKCVAFGEMFLLVMFSFAIAFMFSEYVGVGSAMDEGATAGSATQAGGAGSWGRGWSDMTTGTPGAGGAGGWTPPVTPGAGGEIFSVGAKSVFVEGHGLVNDVAVMRGADGFHYANVKSVGPVVFDNGKNAWVGTAADKLPAGTVESGTLTQTAGSSPTLMQGIFGGQGFGGGVGGALFSGLVWGGIIGGAAYGIAKLMGLNDNQAKSVGLAGFAGGFAGTSLYFVGQNMLAAGMPAAQLPWVFTPMGGLLIGAGIGIAIFVLTYKEQKKELVHFECLAWEPPTGGQNCEKCNENPMMPCSEYRCRSLGQACEIVNPGTEEERCIWKSKGDTSAPHIVPWDEALSPDGLRYVPDTAVSPPNRGFKIIDSEGDNCLPAFTPLEFGVIADEPAQCKIDYEPREKYGEMRYLFGESNLFIEEHTQRLRVMSTEESNGSYIPEVGIGGTFKLWVRCIDANENGEDSAMVAFSYCVDKGPDTTQPIVEGTDIRTGMPVSFGTDNVSIEVYVNEPANCRWSRQDKAYDAMENAMDCGTETYQVNANLNYVCSGRLTGIENRQENWFYFRCMDLSTAPGGRNKMETSHPLMILGTEELTMRSVGPAEEFTGSTSVVPVLLTAETAHGANEGEAICFYSTNNEDFIPMENTGSYLHNQSQDLSNGDYTYYFRCTDGGGNSVEANTTFTVTIDTGVPSITRVLRDGSVLKIITDEEAKCYYSETNCNYNVEDGLALTYENPTNRLIHITEWAEQVTYYIKCEDYQGNQPIPDQCQIIVKASEL
ncbi:MAG: hypothetical protein KJ718_02365 [Nanoarchaeota archaeon]|nr:hypothetical protein [Nanoarchaeota archaeon]MBU1051375.1 hypothetical protein [Nanoarchaeota archaeon]MBU1988390.1 hypothetical protein [Nanoarchaeota archaeon]